MATSQSLVCYWKVSGALLFWDSPVSRSWSVNDYSVAMVIPVNLTSQGTQT